MSGRHIIALGGGGFSMEPDNLALDRYVLRHARRARPRVLFIPTASGDAESYIQRFHASYETLDCEPDHLGLFRASPDWQDKVLRADVIVVGGGNTRNLLAIWRSWKLPALLEQASAAGAVLSGVSAGAICWFDHGVTDSLPGALTPMRCLGWLRGSCCPHYDGESERRPTFLGMVEDGRVPGGLALDDGAAAHVVDGALRRVVTSGPDRGAYRVRRVRGRVREERLASERVD